MKWQAWLGRGLILADAILFAVEAFLGVQLNWHQPVIVAATGLVNMVLALIP